MKTSSLFNTFRADFLAGIVVFLVALPLCLGIANASGVEPFAGLVSGIIGGLVVALLSGSRLSVSGPAAGLIVIVVEAIAHLGSFSAFLTAVVLSGVLQFTFGLLKAGRFAAYVPSSVITGMLAAIGLLLIIKQIPLAMGLGTDVSSAIAISTPFGTISMTALFVSLASLAVLFSWQSDALRRFTVVRAVPAPLVVVLIGILTTFALDKIFPAWAPSSEHMVNLPAFASLASLIDTIPSPDLSQLLNMDVWGVAVTLAIVASLETLLSLEAIEQLDPQKRRASPNRELKAQGIGNLIAGILGGLPITSVIVRSSANVNAGGRSRVSSVVHGILLLVSVFVLTSIINLIPLACLAAILLHTGYKLAKPALFIALARQGLNRFLPFMATVIGVVAIDLLMGIAVGFAACISLAVLANLRRTFTFAQYDDHFLLVFRKDVSFLGKVQLKHYLHSIPEDATLTIDANHADFIDPDVYEIIDAFIREAKDKRITVDCRNFAPIKASMPLLTRWMPKKAAA